jgi:hypothetical protein
MHLPLMTKLILLLDEKIAQKTINNTIFFPKTCFNAKFSILGDHHGSKLIKSLQVDHEYIPNLINILDLL